MSKEGIVKGSGTVDNQTKYLEAEGLTVRFTYHLSVLRKEDFQVQMGYQQCLVQSRLQRSHCWRTDARNLLTRTRKSRCMAAAGSYVKLSTELYLSGSTNLSSGKVSLSRHSTLTGSWMRTSGPQQRIQFRI